MSTNKPSSGPVVLEMFVHIHNQLYLHWKASVYNTEHCMKQVRIYDWWKKNSKIKQLPYQLRLKCIMLREMEEECCNIVAIFIFNFVILQTSCSNDKQMRAQCFQMRQNMIWHNTFCFAFWHKNTPGDHYQHIYV